MSLAERLRSEPVTPQMLAGQGEVGSPAVEARADRAQRCGS